MRIAGIYTCSALALLCGLIIGICFADHPFALATDLEDPYEPVVLLPTNWRASQDSTEAPKLHVILVLKNETGIYHKIIRRYCFLCRFDGDSCDEILVRAENQIANPGSWKESCTNYERCLQSIPGILSTRWPNFTVASEDYLDGYEDGAQEIDAEHLKRVAEMLTDRDCIDTVALASYSNQLLSYFDAAGILDDGESVDARHTTVPCNNMYWAEGVWHAQPRWTGPAKGSAVMKCSQGSLSFTDQRNYSAPDASPWEVYCESFWPAARRTCPVTAEEEGVRGEHDMMDDELNTVANEGVCAAQGEYSAADSCLLYVFGPSGGLQYERAMVSEFGCHVHIFDSSFDNLSPEVEGIKRFLHFHHVQLPGTLQPTGSGGDQSHFSVLPMSTIIKALGHEDRILDIKFDCNGCEWEALNDVYTNLPEAADLVRNVRIIMNVSSVDRPRVLALSQFYRFFIESKKFKLWYRFESVQKSELIFDPIVRKTGFNPLVEVYDLIFHQSVVVPTPEVLGITPDDAPAHISASDIARDKKLKRLNILKPIGSLESFFDMYMHISALNLTVGILQGDPTIHSEVIAPLVELSYAVGFKHVIVYNDYIGYEESRKSTVIGVLESSKRWDIRFCRESIMENSAWDFLVFVTGDEAYRFQPVLSTARKYPDRVLAIHHHPHWITPDVFKRYMFLTPVLGRHRAVFPFFSLEPNEDFSVENSFSHVVHDPRYQHALLLLGSIGEASPEASGIEGRKSKDRDDIIRYLTASEHNIVINIARDSFKSIMTEFPRQTIAMEGVTTREVMFFTSHVNFIWIPIPVGSTYLSGSFASSISYAFAFKKVLVMPKRLSSFYGLEGVVVEYENTVTEVDFSKVDISDFKRRMVYWEDSQRIQNAMNFYRCLFSSKCV